MKPAAQLLAPAFCMSCGGLLTDSVRFRWGALPECYRVGETARPLDAGAVATSLRRFPDTKKRITKVKSWTTDVSSGGQKPFRAAKKSIFL